MHISERKLPDGQYLRFTLAQRITHIGIVISFLICAFTGLPIKYNYTGWAQSAAKFYGGFENMFYFHLFGGFVLTAVSVYHLLYIPYLTYKDKRFPLGPFPSLKDIKDLPQNLKYFLGLTDQKPEFAKYSYKEKFDYMAVFWGMIMIGGSGFMMWFPDWATQYVPRWFIDASRMAHSDEAVLAVVVIFTWHFFNVHFHPDFFPMNKVFITGKMSEELMEHEHAHELKEIQKSLNM